MKFEGSVPPEYRSLKVIGIFGSKGFSDPRLVVDELERINASVREQRTHKIVIAAGVNGIVAETVHEMVNKLPNLHLLVIAPEMKGLDTEDRIGLFKSTVEADEMLLTTANEVIAFTAKTQNANNMIMSCRHVHKKPVKIIVDPKKK